jgi:hypothetical protein
MGILGEEELDDDSGGRRLQGRAGERLADVAETHRPDIWLKSSPAWHSILAPFAMRSAASFPDLPFLSTHRRVLGLKIFPGGHFISVDIFLNGDVNKVFY